MVPAAVGVAARLVVRVLVPRHRGAFGDVASRAVPFVIAALIVCLFAGKRALSLDVLVPLASALQVSLDVLFQSADDGDVVIRPVQHRSGNWTNWQLNRVDGRTMAMKTRIEPEAETPVQRVHPGHDWFLVLEGRALLWLGDRRIEVAAGEAAELSTMTPHVVTAIGGPAELIQVFDREGQRAHVHQ